LKSSSSNPERFAGFLNKVSETFEGKWQKKRFFFLKHLLDLTLHPSMNPYGDPALFPMHQMLVLLFDAFKPAAFQSSILSVLDRVFTAALAVRVGDPGGIGHGAAMSQHGGIKRV